ncbi:hypothetical protein [Amycolatopsis thailandensis]|uniref:Uncharacterized protein n=1 Tax=Amycolatopsis thailandensis TaxID=589330 RepID=A0A229SAC0_9PSEU|nr:hypothetical protein [Amycolatopsis thailandensis]OXM55691.1 hypothetical protein CFP71_17020 [Amycolatopsis thailandensis]
MASGKWGFGETRMPAKVALWLALLWDVVGSSWIVLGLTDEGPMRWNNWFNVGLGAWLLLSSSHYWTSFVRQRRKRRAAISAD